MTSDAPEALEELVLRLVQEMDRLKERLDRIEGAQAPTLELQHRGFVARLRQSEEN